LSGCKKNAPGSAKVSGKVLYGKDAPLRFGLVQFYTEAGMVGESAIRADGSYSIAGLPEGAVKICVQAKRRDVLMKEWLYKDSGEKPGDQPAPTETSRLMDKLTEKYGNVETTPLRFTVRGGEQHYDIVLSLP
jgi:hypothetical protein